MLCALLVLVCDCDGTLDLSNLDLKNFQFFRYTQVLPNGEIQNVMAPPPNIHDHFSRAKAGRIIIFAVFIVHLIRNLNESLQWPHIFENCYWATRRTMRKPFLSFSIQTLMIYDINSKKNMVFGACIWSNRSARATCRASHTRVNYRYTNTKLLIIIM